MRPEDRLQSRVRMYLKDALPAPGWWSSIAHERKQSVFSGQVQKARGIKRGLSDVMIWYRGMFYGIELKVSSPISESQAAFGAAMEANGFKWVVIWSVVQLDEYLRAEKIPIPYSFHIEALRHDAALESPGRVVGKSRSPGKPRQKRPSSKAIAIGNKSQLPLGMR